MLSKKIVNESHGQDSSYFLGWEEYEKNPYHQAQNPKGIIQMGLAENQVSYNSFDIIIIILNYVNIFISSHLNKCRSLLRRQYIYIISYGKI